MFENPIYRKIGFMGLTTILKEIFILWVFNPFLGSPILFH